MPEVIRLARTIETWQAPIIAAVQTGLTNARTEGYNRIVKHVGRKPRQPTPPRTVGLHPPITASHTQPAPMPLLTTKSRESFPQKEVRIKPRTFHPVGSWTL